MLEYYHKDSFDALIGLEIGGSNGLLPLSIGSSREFDRPVVDADWMGKEFSIGFGRMPAANNHECYRASISQLVAGYSGRAREEPDCSMCNCLGRWKSDDIDQSHG